MAIVSSIQGAPTCGEAIRAVHEEAVAAAERRRRARWRAGLQVVGIALLLAAVAS